MAVRIDSLTNWRVIVVVIIVSCGVALASMAVVRMRNLDRGDTAAVEWALEDLRAVPESTLIPVCEPSDYQAAVDRYLAAVREHKIPVDSVRSFYQLYARLARDGLIVPSEIIQLSGSLGYTVNKIAGENEQ